jgi:trehalose 6-phosphate phosphatase
LRAGRLLVAVDFDGTLAPIVPRPDEAALPSAARVALQRLARRHDTDLAIVSGRALEDLRPRIGIAGIYYAGNHGLEIEGPGLQEIHQEAALARPRISACAAKLRTGLAQEQGVSLEDKGLTLSIHYRLAPDPAAEDRIRGLVQRCAAALPGLRTTEGKKVIEVRPAVEWDKGRALRFLLDILDAGSATATPALFVGDDRTDEDAFRALRGRGDGIVVAPAPPPGTAATAYLSSPEQVATLLEALAESAPKLEKSWGFD